MAVNSRRVLLGALAGGVLWNAWSVCIYLVVLGKRYAAAQQAGFFLKQPRYPLFAVYWIVLLFVLSYLRRRLALRIRSCHARRGPPRCLASWISRRLCLWISRRARRFRLGALHAIHPSLADA